MTGARQHVGTAARHYVGGALLAQASVREAVAAAGAALPGWSDGGRRGRLLFELGELLLAERAAAVAALRAAGSRRRDAEQEVQQAAAWCTFFAGLADKLQQLLGSRGDAAAPWSIAIAVGPCGVVGIGAAQRRGLLGLLQLLLPPLCAGNTAVALVGDAAPPRWLGERLHAGGFPAGVVNLLAGDQAPLRLQLAAEGACAALLCAGTPDAALGAAAAAAGKPLYWAPLGLAAQEWAPPHAGVRRATARAATAGSATERDVAVPPDGFAPSPAALLRRVEAFTVRRHVAQAMAP